MEGFLQVFVAHIDAICTWVTWAVLKDGKGNVYGEVLIHSRNMFNVTYRAAALMMIMPPSESPICPFFCTGKEFRFNMYTARMHPIFYCCGCDSVWIK